MRINKFLASAGIASRRRVERLVLSGEIKVNGEITQDLSTDIGEGDVVEYKQRTVRPKSKLYFALYKPVGYVSTTGDKHAEKIVTQLIPSKERLFIVGRLDMESEGLMILTNDGDYAQTVSHPRNDHEKEYEVVVGYKERSALTQAIVYLKAGITIDGYKTRPARVEIMDEKDNSARLKITLKEGRNRQIRNTVQKAGARVHKLIRTRIGNVLIGDLKEGDFRQFSL